MTKIWKDKNLILPIVIIISIASFLFFRENIHKESTSELSEKINNLEKEKEDLQLAIKNLETDRDSLNDLLEETADKLNQEDKRNDKLEDDLDLISELMNTDEELLLKYSRVFFLNEHYTPSKLSKIDDEWVSNTQKDLYIQSGVRDNLEDLLEDARDDGINLQILSAYRSFGEQASLKYNYLIQYGSGANTFSADQGYSEHQLGTTVDFTTPELGSYLDTTFDQTAAFKWLEENAYKYGFVMSYTKGNSYYQYEPWHWRFVSENLAKDLHRKEMSFYDMDQRNIYEYLIDFFD